MVPQGLRSGSSLARSCTLVCIAMSKGGCPGCVAVAMPWKLLRLMNGAGCFLVYVTGYIRKAYKALLLFVVQ